MVAKALLSLQEVTERLGHNSQAYVKRFVLNQHGFPDAANKDAVHDDSALRWRRAEIDDYMKASGKAPVPHTFFTNNGKRDHRKGKRYPILDNTASHLFISRG